MLEWTAQNANPERAQEIGKGLLGMGMLCGSCLVPVLFIVSLVMAIRKKGTGWTITAVLSGLITLILVAFTVFAMVSAPRIAEQVNALRAEPREVSSLDNDVHLTVPGNWRALDSLHEEASLSYGNETREEYLILLTDPKADFDGSLEEHVDLTSSNMLDALEGAEVVSREALQVGGHDAIRVELRGTSDYVRIIYVQLTVETEDAFQQFLVWTLPSKLDEALPVFEKVLASIRF